MGGVYLEIVVEGRSTSRAKLREENDILGGTCFEFHEL
jgi:hypothetical protein